ncbi:MAG: class I SAM-dependent methyltransferase [Nakamurella sp.]
MVSQLVAHFDLDNSSRIVNVGAGTGQVVVPLARRVRLGIAIEPEPDLLQLLRARQDLGDDILTVLGTDRDLPLVRQAAGDRRIDLITVANALHFMDLASVFADARELLRTGGGIAIISHGCPCGWQTRPGPER